MMTPPTHGLSSARNITVLRVAVGVMLPLAALWLAYQFWRLVLGGNAVWSTSPIGAVDLKVFHESVHEWFAGRPVYTSLIRAFYPPATYPILWPLMGWLDFTAARWLWAATTVASLAWFARVIVVESGASSSLERTFVALMLLATYPAGATIGNGQLTVHLLPPLVTSLLVLSRERRGWPRDVLGSALMLVALAKPSVSAPFFWVVLFSMGRIRPAVLIVLGYAALTALAISFQTESTVSLLRDWITMSAEEATHGGYADLSFWLDAMGLARWMSAASLLALVALGAWVYRHRQRDLWLLIGVVAIAARYWMHHRWYDDLLMVLPMVTLFRLAKQADAGSGAGAGKVTVPGILLGLTVLSMLAPGGLYLFPPPLNTIYVAGQTLISLAVLVYLVSWCEREVTAA